MKTRIAIGSLCALALVGLAYYPAAAHPTAAQDSYDATSSSGAGSFAFGLQVAGTYFSNAGFGGTLTLNADGTVVALSGQCCGNAPNVQSESYGNWVRTGARTIEISTVAIGTNWAYDAVDPDGHLSTAPVSNFIATPTEVLTFAPDFQSYTGSLCTGVWFYGLGAGMMPDVLTETPDLVVGPFPVSGTRLPVEPLCP